MSASIHSGRNWWWFYLCCNFLMNWYLGNKTISFQLDFESILMFASENSRLNCEQFKNVFSFHFPVHNSKLEFLRKRFSVFGFRWEMKNSIDFKVESNGWWNNSSERKIKDYGRVFISFEQSNRSSFILIIILSAFFERNFSLRSLKCEKMNEWQRGGSRKFFN